MAKKARTDPARSRPLTLPFLRDLGALKDLAPPTGRFDPSGAWTSQYRLWLVQRWRGGGSLRLRREPLSEGVRLHVDLAVVEVSGYLRRLHAVLDCAADAFCTPRSWKLTSQNLDRNDRPTTGTAFTETGTIRGGRLEVRFAKRTGKQEVPQPVTSNWSLFDLVQRLPAEKTRPLRFAVLEEMDLLKPAQRLAFRGTQQIELGGQKLRLRGYHQVGRGVLPWQYWVDDAGRLLLAFSGVRAFLYDPNAEQWMQDRLRKARGAGREGGRAK